MSQEKNSAEEMKASDLRHGMRGSLTLREALLAGSEPVHQLENPHLASPDSAVPAGQSTHG